MEASQVRFGRVTVYFGEKNGKYPDGNQLVVTGTDSKVVFDTPLSANRLQHELAGADMAILGHVHEDHTCGLHLLPDAEVFAPEADVAALRSMEGMMAHYGYAPQTLAAMVPHIVDDFYFQPRPDAQGYAGGRVWELGGSRVRAIHMPGHTHGHSVLLVEPEGVAFIGDIDLSGFGPYYGDACSNLEEFRETLERIEHMEAKVWVTSHHKGIITEREQFVALLHAFKDRIRQREEAMLAELAGAGRTLEELVAHRFLFPKGYQGLFVEDAERMTIREHMRALMAQGRVSEEEGRFVARAPAG
ncbi:MAG: MBL fold metallo-hydrolase [SAR324 cluster bacterium]|nr:MBL fold metallo-hydrolase [SAR324 cluster bacterium]MCZ6644964.1 MBL fold metallo-hydrolase [SAR324 cluster bacterium]